MKFDLTNLPEPSNSFDPIPPGWYPVTVEEAEWRTSKANPANEYLNLTLRVHGDDYANRVVFHMLNLVNTSETARNIAMHDLKNMFLAMGAEEAKLAEIEKDSIPGFILDKPFKVKLSIKLDKQYGDKNVIKDFDSMEQAIPAKIDPGNIPF